SKTDIPLIHYLKTNFGSKPSSLTTSRLTSVVLFKFWNKSNALRRAGCPLSSPFPLRGNFFTCAKRQLSAAPTGDGLEYQHDSRPISSVANYRR
ncbi:MAG: hypothetical protein LBQ66_01050, partial [Planctomycetaceae bacterium]|nr:hypothetical protein [Planctomycetaceae bacterium]